MQFSVHARGQGKRVRVTDCIGGGEVFNKFLNPDDSSDVTVATNDGQTGDVDITAQMRNDSPWVIVQSDYAVRSGESLK